MLSVVFSAGSSNGRRQSHPREIVREFLDIRTQKWATFAAVWNEVSCFKVGIFGFVSCMCMTSPLPPSYTRGVSFRFYVFLLLAQVMFRASFRQI